MNRLTFDPSVLLAGVTDILVYVVGIVIFWGLLCAATMAVLNFMDRR